jgi:hypothetical protein
MTAKKSYFNKLLLKSNNKTKTRWNIVKSITNNKGPIENVIPMNVKTKPSGNSHAIANAFNNYFSSAAVKLLIKNFSRKTLANNKDSLSYLQQNFHHLFPSIILSNTNTFDIKKIILSLQPKNSRVVMTRYHHR